MSPFRLSSELAIARRIVVKIGSALLVDDPVEHPGDHLGDHPVDHPVDHSGSDIRRAWLAALAEDIASLKTGGRDVVIVSSGAIAAGRRQLGLPAGRLRLDEKQAAAATGMIRLAHAYQEALARFDITVAQVLLTLDDSEHRRRYINARATLTTLLRRGAVPLINENDTVATDEIRFGDNDRLSARVAAMVSADTLVLLSDIDGLYTADPRKDPAARLVPEVREITPEIEAMADHTHPGYGTGGMITKLEAARIALAAGCRMVIAPGAGLHPLARIADGGTCTWFLPAQTPGAARKRWIFGTLKPAGALVVDAGAVSALARGKSLLPAGVTAVEGDFEKGAAVVIKTGDGAILGRGLVGYGAADARRIIGHKTREIEDRLGYRGREELVHRDDLALETRRAKR
ncbi:MAG: glutamate 5-kinase [Rhodospirillales bacterium]